VFAFGYDSQGGGRVSFQAVLRREWQHIKKAVFQNKLDLGLHCLRHTFAVKLYQHSFDPLLVQNLMGHKSYSSTEKYLKYADETKQLEVSRRLYEERVLKCQ
jgi:site-specific recombinase XerD